MSRPILHVGYHKTGTTWLQAEGFGLLQGVERVHDPEMKALFKDLALNEDTPDIASIRASVERNPAMRPVISYEFLSGAVLNGSPHRSRTAHRLAKALPEAEVLMVVRRQPEMLQSLHAQYVNQGGTEHFERFLSGHGRGFTFDPEHLEYDKLVFTYSDLFGLDSVLVLPYELLRVKPTEFLSRLADRWGTRVTGEVRPRIINPSLSGWQLDMLRAWNRLFRSTSFNPQPLVPLRNAEKMRWLMQGRSRGKNKSRSSAMKYAERYRESNQRLSARCDLRGWGYPGVE